MTPQEVWSYIKIRSEKFTTEVLILCLALLVYSAIVTIALMRDTKGTMPLDSALSKQLEAITLELKVCRQQQYNALFDYTPPKRGVVNE